MARPTVLVADPDPVALGELAELLATEARVDVHRFASAAALRAALDERPADGVVVDVSTGGDARALIDPLLAADPAPALVLVVRAGDPDGQAWARSRVGPLRVAARPFDVADLVSKLHAGLERRALLSELATARGAIHAEHRALDAATDRLVEAEKLAAVGRVMGGLAHELTGQLALVGYAEAIRTRVAGDPELVEFADVIVNAQKRLVAMVDQIRHFTREPDAAALVREPCDVAAVVDEALALARFDRDARARELARDFRARPLAALDQARFAQVVLNLVSNAVLATRPGDTIAIELDEEPGALTLAVADHGVGMAPEVLARLGEPFFTTRGERASGLGVGICARIVEEHGGTLRFASELGRGTRAVLRLPTLGAAP
jgi:signal transduction histidine kinase